VTIRYCQWSKIEKGSKIKIMVKPMRSVHKTWADLSSDEIFHKFFKGFLELLQMKHSKREIIGHNYTDSYYTLWPTSWYAQSEMEALSTSWTILRANQVRFSYSKRYNRGSYRRKFKCECQLLGDDRSRRRFELERIYGVDFSGMSGQGDFDVVWIELTPVELLQFEF
jgi:hypothetical protein